MKLMYKQLLKEILKNKFFLFLLYVLSSFTSFMYYFVHFAIDKNLPRFGTNLAYRQGMLSNIILARNILLVFVLLTCFGLSLFFHRFFSANEKELGLLKAIGCTNASIRNCVLFFTSVLSAAGAVTGLFGGCFASVVLLEASAATYRIDGLVRGISFASLAAGSLFPLAAFCGTAFLMYFNIGKRETALLIDGGLGEKNNPELLRLADRAAALFPSRWRLSVRLTLRRPVTVFLTVLSVTVFLILFIMAYSLNLSSKTVYDSQTEGHFYLYDIHFERLREIENDRKELPYLETGGSFSCHSHSVEQRIVGMEENTKIVKLTDRKGNELSLPETGEILIGEAAARMYGIREGDTLDVCLLDGTQTLLTVKAVTYNGAMDCIYMKREDLARLISLPKDSASGVLAMANRYPEEQAVTKEDRIEELERNLVSNKSSAVINQVIGCVIGTILLCLALFINFQDSTEDILILSMLGYRTKEIEHMLIDIYRPVLCVSFFLTLLPGIWTVKGILRNMSLQIGDYMPFQTNIFVIAGIFMLLFIIYGAALFAFRRGTARMILNKRC